MDQSLLVMVLRRDLARIREFADVRMIQPGTLWCQIKTHQHAIDHMLHHSIWFEIQPMSQKDQTWD